MSYCISPTCPAPDKNSPDTNFCMSCGAKILLKDRYRALKLLGQGGFGKTFKAVDEDQPRKPLCVIKQFAFSNNHPETRQIALKLFYDEAQHLEALGKHDQIPELLAYFDVEGQPYLVQQFIDGQDLEQELATAGTFNQAKIRELLESLLPVLDFIHHQSPPVIHRDIKPANIIRRRSDGGLVLVDFGAAKQASQTMLAKTGTVIGSPEYTAPEQARGKPAFASDIYSLGVTCVHLLTQVSPFDLFDVSTDAWVWRDYLVDNRVDEKLGKVLDKMIANSLLQRCRSAEDILSTSGLKPDRLNVPTTGNSDPPISPVKKPIILNHQFTPRVTDIIEDLSNGIELEMLYIPAGSFMMGSNKISNEKPLHRVSLLPFYMGKYTITQAQYHALIGKNPSRFKGDNHPVESVSWDAAMEFCQKLSQYTGKQYILPSESQWEYACRAGTTTPFYFGAAIKPDLVNCDGCTYRNTPKGVHRRTTAVGNFPPNAFGLYDMHGNVWEHCLDGWYDNYDETPIDGSARIGTHPHLIPHLLRGGSWRSRPSSCESGHREMSSEGDEIGFRVVCKST
jgi:formylglycine-generating enzyme required for sulfatase activity/DNA-directed RNA polymerase subunit RPC12/RpoP